MVNSVVPEIGRLASKLAEGSVHPSAVQPNGPTGPSVNNFLGALPTRDFALTSAAPRHNNT